MMDIDFQMKGNALVASVHGRVDTGNASVFEKKLVEELNQEEKWLVFDLSGLEYISSAGLRVLLSTAKIMKSKGGDIRLAATQGPVKKVFQISGFFSLFKHFDTTDAALENL
ncbi:MAG: STAS domain-containing protein [Pseudomonadota bacterium]